MAENFIHYSITHQRVSHASLGFQDLADELTPLFVLACGRPIMPCSDRGTLSLWKASVGTPLAWYLTKA